MKTDKIVRAVKALETKIIEDRRRFHIDAEVGGNEYRTMGYILSEMTALGLEPIWVNEGLSAIFEFDTGKSGKTLVLRADIDALAMQEDEFNLKQKKVVVSKNDGACHACGHDGHAAMLISVAKIIVENKDGFSGKFVFFFESDEEGSGKFDCSSAFVNYLKAKNPDAIWGIHLVGFMEKGKISVQAGPRMAVPGMFKVKIIGRGGHGSCPQQAINPISAAAELVCKLQSIISTAVPADEIATLAVTSVQGGDIWNVIPDSCMVMGNFRCCSQSVYNIFADQIPVVVEGICAANQCKAEYIRIPQKCDKVHPVWNDEKLSGIAEKALDKLFPHSRVSESVWMASESFGMYQDVVPGVFAFIGVKNEDLGSGAAHHNAKYDIDESALLYGVALTVQFASDFMNDVPENL